MSKFLEWHAHFNHHPTQCPFIMGITPALPTPIFTILSTTVITISLSSLCFSDCLTHTHHQPYLHLGSITRIFWMEMGKWKEWAFFRQRICTSPALSFWIVGEYDVCFQKLSYKVEWNDAPLSQCGIMEMDGQWDSIAQEVCMFFIFFFIPTLLWHIL